MAFVPVLPSLPNRPVKAHSCSTTNMVQPPMSRRAVLRLAAFSFAGVAAAAFAKEEIDIKELKEDIKGLKYEDEVNEIGPDPMEKNILRTKKKKVEPSYKGEEKELIKEEQQEYKAMVEKEAKDEANIKAKFSKGK